MVSAQDFISGQVQKQSKTIKYFIWIMFMLGALNIVAAIFQPLAFIMEIFTACMLVGGGFILLQATNFREGKPVVGFRPEQQPNLRPEYQPDTSVPACRNCYSPMNRVNKDAATQHLLCPKCGREVVVGFPNAKHLIKEIYAGQPQAKAKLISGGKQFLSKVGENASNMHMADHPLEETD